MDPTSGGPCQGIRYINNETVQLGTTREVVCLDSPTASFIGIDSFPVHALGPAKGKWQFSAKLIPWLTKNVDRFDVVIINGLWIYSSFAGYKVLSNLRKQNSKKKGEKSKSPKLFIMPHGMLDPYFQRAANRKLKAIRNLLYWMFIEKKVVNSADGILFTCKTEMLLARKTFFSYNPKKEIDIGYGIYPPPAFSHHMRESFINSCPGLDSRPYLLFLSRVNEKKGLDLLIKSYATTIKQLLADEKEPPCLVIAGPGLNTPYGKKMTDLAASYPLIKDLFFFTGMLSGDAKWGALYGCDAFVLPSHQENFGIAVVEALACKKPVLISNQINIWTEINESGGGIVVPDTLEGTKKMLQQWLKLPPCEKTVMGARAFAIYSKKYQIEHSSRVFLAAINS